MRRASRDERTLTDRPPPRHSHVQANNLKKSKRSGRISGRKN